VLCPMPIEPHPPGGMVPQLPGEVSPLPLQMTAPARLVRPQPWPCSDDIAPDSPVVQTSLLGQQKRTVNIQHLRAVPAQRYLPVFALTYQ
jgi:hypothetical protein